MNYGLLPICIVNYMCWKVSFLEGYVNDLSAFGPLHFSPTVRLKQVLVHGLIHSFSMHLQCSHQINVCFYIWKTFLLQPLAHQDL